MNEYMIFCPNEASLLSFGELIAKTINAPAIIHMEGALGAGKTTLARGLLRGLGYQNHVKSPTYTLVESYEINKIKVFHFDLYRIDDSYELELMGIRDYFSRDAICLIEWPKKGDDILPPPDLICHIDMHENGRTIKCIGFSENGKTILQRLATTVPSAKLSSD